MILFTLRVFTLPDVLRLTIRTFVTVAVLASASILASACGSTSTSSTSTETHTSKAASANVGTSAPAGATARATSRVTTPKPAQAAPKASPAKPKHQPMPTHSSEGVEEIEKPNPREPSTLHTSHVFPPEAIEHFLADCRAAGESATSCECVSAEYQAWKVEEGLSLSELLGVEVALKGHGTFRDHAWEYAHACNIAAATPARRAPPTPLRK